MLTICFFLISACEQEAQLPTGLSNDGVVASDAVVREPVAGRRMTTAYLQLKNNTEQSLRLLTVSTPIANSVEIHEHQHVDGQMRMRQLEYAELAAQGNLVFEPGGLHLMLFGVEMPSDPNNTQIPLTLGFDNGEQITVIADLESLLD